MNCFYKAPNKPVSSPFEPKTIPQGSQSLYSWLNYKELPKQCLWFLLWVLFPHLVFIEPRICTVIWSKTSEERQRGRRKEGKCTVTCVTAQVAQNLCVILWSNLDPDAGLSHPPLRGFFSLLGSSFGDGWLALDLLYYHSFLLSLHGQGLSNLSDPPWMQLHAQQESFQPSENNLKEGQ